MNYISIFIILSTTIICACLIAFSLYRFYKSIQLEKYKYSQKTNAYLVSTNDEETEREFNEYKSKYTNAVEFLPILFKNNVFNRSSLDKYFESLIKYVRRAEKEILILDLLNEKDYLYLFKELDSIGNDVSYIANKYKAYYNEIENKLNDKIIYKRILQVPHISKENIFNEKNMFSKYMKGKLTEEIIELSSYPLIEHIEKSWRVPNFELYFLPQIAFSYSYIVIDQTYVLTTYYRYMKSGMSRLDEFYVNRRHSIKDQIETEFNSAIEKYYYNKQAEKDKCTSDFKDAKIKNEIIGRVV